MKKLFLTNLLFITMIFKLTATVNNGPVKLTCIVDSIYTQEPQWVYWFSLDENQCEIADSCFLEKNQKTFHMQYHLENDYSGNWLTFTKAGPKQMWLSLAPKENVTVYINNLSFFPKTEGSIGTREEYEFGLKIKQIHGKTREFQELLANPANDSLQKNIMDSLSYYQKQLSHDVYLDFLRTCRSSHNFVSQLKFIKDSGKISREQADSLENIMLERFPHSRSVEMYFDNSPSAPATKESERNYKRYEDIVWGPKNTPTKHKEKSNFLGPKTKAEYSIGSKIANIKLEAIDGKKKEIYNSKEEYILIDFWASWCGPCIRCYPDLLKTKKKYKKELSIYAISIDGNEDTWKKAVERLDPDSLLIHVRVAPGSKQGKILNKQYAISRIPANFLLDKDRKIIAVDLYDDDLEKKMSELIQK